MSGGQGRREPIRATFEIACTKISLACMIDDSEADLLEQCLVVAIV